MSTELRLIDIPIFSELSRKEVKSVERLMTDVNFPEGKMLTKQDTPGREFMVIVDGTARVEIDGRTVAHLSSGDFLGELAIITGAKRGATITATSEIDLKVLNRREFMALLDESPALTRKVLVGAVKRLQENQPKTS